MKYTPPIGGAAGDPYVDANLGTGTEGSEVPARAIEAPQRELDHLISVGGLTPSTSDNTQVAQAVLALIAAASKGYLAGSVGYNASATLGASSIGKIVEYSGSTASQTLTLPLAGSYSDGAGIYFVNLASVAVTLARQGSDNIRLPSSSGFSDVSSVVFQPGESALLVGAGGALWREHNSTRAARLAPSSLGTNGWQRLPSGLIVQWGRATAEPAATTNYSYPITFPNGYFVGMAQIASTWASDTTVRHINVSTSQFKLDTSNAVNSDAEWFAIGY